MDSDFNGKDIKFYTKTIKTYSGLCVNFIPGGLKWLEKAGVLKMEQEKEKGKFKGKRLIFTPQNIQEIARITDTRKTDNGLTDNGRTDNGFNDTSEDSTPLEDSKKGANKNSLTPAEKKFIKRIGKKQFELLKANPEHFGKIENEKKLLFAEWLEHRQEIKKPCGTCEF